MYSAIRQHTQMKIILKVKGYSQHRCQGWAPDTSGTLAETHSKWLPRTSLAQLGFHVPLWGCALIHPSVKEEPGPEDISE